MTELWLNCGIATCLYGLSFVLLMANVDSLFIIYAKDLGFYDDCSAHINIAQNFASLEFLLN